MAAELVIPNGVDPVGVASTTMAVVLPYVGAAMAVGLAFLFSWRAWVLCGRRLPGWLGGSEARNRARFHAERRRSGELSPVRGRGVPF